MQKLNLKDNKANNNLVSEKDKVMNMYKELSYRQQKVKREISNLYYKINRKELLSVEAKHAESSEEDFSVCKQQLGVAIQEKEILNKDIAILQKRLKFLENEIGKTKPWWQQIFTSI